MTDRELLELAAKAAGYRVYHYQADNRVYVSDDLREVRFSWSPLTEDSDALRLCARWLLLCLEISEC
jgi:hypothetical protein